MSIVQSRELTNALSLPISIQKPTLTDIPSAVTKTILERSGLPLREQISAQLVCKNWQATLKDTHSQKTRLFAIHIRSITALSQKDAYADLKTLYDKAFPQGDGPLQTEVIAKLHRRFPENSEDQTAPLSNENAWCVLRLFKSINTFPTASSLDPIMSSALTRQFEALTTRVTALITSLENGDEMAFATLKQTKKLLSAEHEEFVDIAKATQRISLALLSRTFMNLKRQQIHSLEARRT